MGIDVQFATGALSPEVVKKYFSVVKNLVKLGKGLARLTPTTIDDNVIEGLDTAMTMVEPYLGEPWVYDLINSVIGLFKSSGPEAAVELLKTGILAALSR